MNRVFTVEYDHRNNGSVEQCDLSIVEALRKEFCQDHRHPLCRAVEKVDQNITLKYHSNIHAMPVEIWHGSEQVLRRTRMRMETRKRKLNLNRKSLVS